MQSVNQVKHLFVVNALVTGGNQVSSLGDLKVVKSAVDGKVRLQYVGQGGKITSDAIDPAKVIYAASKKYTDLRKPLKKAVLKLDSTVNSGLPIAGEDYIVDIVVSNYIALSDESTLVKFGAVHATQAMAADAAGASAFYLALAKSFARNFSRDINKFFKFYVTEEASNLGTVATSWQEVTPTSTNTPSSAFTGIVIVEQSQEADYVKGEFQVETVNFQVAPHVVMDRGEEVAPFGDIKVVAIGTPTNFTGKTAISGTYDLSDLEFFCAGERGDQYRQVGYPRTIRTKYMVDLSKEYNTVDLAYFFQGRGIDMQHSDKGIVLLMPVGSAGHELDLANSVIAALNSALAIQGTVAVSGVEAGSGTASGTSTMGASIATLS